MEGNASGTTPPIRILTRAPAERIASSAARQLALIGTSKYGTSAGGMPSGNLFNDSGSIAFDLHAFDMEAIADLLCEALPVGVLGCDYAD